jgi:hypothetical protein
MLGWQSGLALLAFGDHARLLQNPELVPRLVLSWVFGGVLLTLTGAIFWDGRRALPLIWLAPLTGAACGIWYCWSDLPNGFRIVAFGGVGGAAAGLFGAFVGALMLESGVRAVVSGLWQAFRNSTSYRRGQIAATRTNLRRLLESRFASPIPPRVHAAIRHQFDYDTIARWFDAGLAAGSLEEFQSAIGIPTAEEVGCGTVPAGPG